jgi:hypothetical protein
MYYDYKNMFKRRCQGPSQPLVPDEEMPDACSSDAAASTAAPSPSP